MKLFRELGERAKRLEAEVEVYRAAMITLAARGGHDVPAFLRTDGASLNEVKEGDVERLREWLARIMSVPQTHSGRARPSSRGGARGGGGRRRPGSRGRREPAAESEMET